MNSLSVAGKRNVIHPLIPREMKTCGGEALLPEKLQDFFALRLADSNALQRLGMEVDQNLEGTVAFAVQSGVPTAAFRNNSNRTQAFEANQLAKKPMKSAQSQSLSSLPEQSKSTTWSACPAMLKKCFFLRVEEFWRQLF